MVCQYCGKTFSSRTKINGQVKCLASRKYCLECSPWGDHRTKPIGTNETKNREREIKKREPDDVFIDAVKESISIAQVIRILNRAAVGTNYRYVKERVKALHLDVSHWKGRSHGTSVQNKFPPSRCLVESSPCNRGCVKRMILREKLLPYKCFVCEMEPIWNGKPLVLRLDHINGVRDDNRLENLRFICPNCDAQTQTFCGKNKKAPVPERSIGEDSKSSQ